MSNQRVKLSNGKYCYSGPGCKWHSPTGISAAKKELRAAENDLHASTSISQLINAKERHKEACKVYDSTSEGLETLQKAYDEEGDYVEKGKLLVRLEEAKTRAEEAEKQQQKIWNDEAATQNTFVLSDNHSYDVPTYKEVNPGMYSAIVGSKYSEKYRPTKEIAKDIRNDLKEAQKAGYLPANLKYSVVTDTGRMSNGLRVTVQGTSDAQTLVPDPHFTDSTMDSPEAKELRDRVKNVLDAYNSQSIHGEHDYFNMNYWSSVEIETESRAKYRKQEAQDAKDKRAAGIARKSFTAEIQKVGKDKYLAERGVTMDYKMKDGTAYAVIPETPYVVVQHVGANKTTSDRIYDLSAVKTGDKTLVEVLGDVNSSALRKNARKLQIDY